MIRTRISKLLYTNTQCLGLDSSFSGNSELSIKNFIQNIYHGSAIIVGTYNILNNLKITISKVPTNYLLEKLYIGSIQIYNYHLFI